MSNQQGNQQGAGHGGGSGGRGGGQSGSNRQRRRRAQRNDANIDRRFLQLAEQNLVTAQMVLASIQQRQPQQQVSPFFFGLFLYVYHDDYFLDGLAGECSPINALLSLYASLATVFPW